MIRFIKSKLERIRSNFQRPILKTGEYLDQFIFRSIALAAKSLIQKFRVYRHVL